MPKNKPNKGLLKRIRITKSGKIKMGRAGGRHLRSHKSAQLRRGYRAPKYALASEAGRFGAMLFRRVTPAERTAGPMPPTTGEASAAKAKGEAAAS